MDEERAQDENADRTAATTEEAFHETLRSLVVEAAANGVDVRGGWPVTRENGMGMWDVEITGVTQSTTAHVDDTDSPVTSVVAAVAAREDVETTELPPLQDSIDHDILEALLTTGGSGSQYVRFQYCGYEVMVRADGSIVLEG